MPQIIVTSGHGDEQTMTLRERVNVSDFESERFAANLVERLGWAVVDATEAESGPSTEPGEQPERRQGSDAQRPRRNRPITGERRGAKQRQQHLEPVGS
jgi:hypothetical protein